MRDLRVRFPIRRGLAAARDRLFQGGRRRLASTSRAGRTLALVGESGCGKTTTGKAIVQLLRGQRRDRGPGAAAAAATCSTCDGDALHAARRDIQIIFQDPFASLNPRMRVLEILEEGLIALRPEMDAARARARASRRLVEQVGLRDESLERYPHEFSGGQRQRIAIARALAVRAEADRLRRADLGARRVGAGADPEPAARSCSANSACRYLFITHNIGVVEYLADDVAVMRAGRIVEQGTCDDVLQRPQAAYTRTLLAAVPRVMEPPRSLRLLPPGGPPAEGPAEPDPWRGAWSRAAVIGRAGRMACVPCSLH